jgi:hypothetical protein
VSFADERTWIGGYFELSLEVSEQRSDDKLFAALEAVWSYPLVSGIYLDRNIEPANQPQVSVLREYIAGYGVPLYGLAHFATFSVACGTFPIRVDEGGDWLDFSIPFGALSPYLPLGGFPFGTSEPHLETSLTTIDDWLIRLGRRVFQFAPFALGLVGFETSGTTYARDVRLNGIPDERITSYLWPHDGSLEIVRRNLTA